jgi:hypothetical protein
MVLSEVRTEASSVLAAIAERDKPSLGGIKLTEKGA